MEEDKNFNQFLSMEQQDSAIPEEGEERRKYETIIRKVRYSINPNQESSSEDSIEETQ